MYFSEVKKMFFLFCSTSQGVLKDYGSMCAFKIIAIFLSKPFVGDAIAKGI